MNVDMEIDWSKIIPMSISAFAACVSVVFAHKARRSQTKLIENKLDIEALSELIELLKNAKAVREYAHDFKDDDFIAADNLTEVPAMIAKLVQNPEIEPIIKKEDWNLPISNLSQKINHLNEIRRSLF